MVSDGKNSTLTLDSKDGKTTVSSNNDTKKTVVRVEGASGKFEAGGELTEATLGLPFYPGSKATETGNVNVDSPEGKMASCTRRTLDVPEKVKQFYSSRLKALATSNNSNEGSTMILMGGKTDAGREVTINIMRAKDEKSTTISVSTIDKSAAKK